MQPIWNSCDQSDRNWKDRIYSRTLNSAGKHNGNGDCFQTSPAVEDTHAATAAVMYLVVTKHWVALGPDPDAGHRVVKDLVVLDDAKAAVEHQDSDFLSAPDLVASYQRVAAGSVKKRNKLFHTQSTPCAMVIILSPLETVHLASPMLVNEQLVADITISMSLPVRWYCSNAHQTETSDSLLTRRCKLFLSLWYAGKAFY